MLDDHFANRDAEDTFKDAVCIDQRAAQENGG
jgi:hypothetical protein